MKNEQLVSILLQTGFKDPLKYYRGIEMHQTIIPYRVWKIFCLLLVAGLCQACTQNRITSSWAAKPLDGPVTGPILIVGAFKDPIAHKIFEDSFVVSFRNIGIKAIPSYQYGLGTSPPTKEELRQVVKKSGAQVFLISHIVNEKTTTEQYLTKHQDVAAVMYWDGSDNYHTYIYQRDQEGDRVSRTVDQMQASLFESESGKHIWSAWSKSIDYEKLLREDDQQLEQLFIKNMQDHKIL